VTGRRSWLAVALQWRNWPVLVKVGMVLVVPVVTAMVLGVLRVQADVALSSSYGDVERLAALRGELVPTLVVLQRERNLSVQDQAVVADTYRQQIQSVDVIVAGLDKLVRETPNLGPAAEAGYLDLKKALGTRTELRQQVLAGADSTTVLNGYGTITQAVLDFDRLLVGRFPDQELTGYSTALYDLQVAREQVSLQHALVLVGIRRGELEAPERERLIEADVRLADRIGDTYAVAPPDLWQEYLGNVTGKDVEARQDMVRQARAEQQPVPASQRGRARPTMPFGAPEWNASSDTTAGLMAQVARTAGTQLRTASAALQDSTSNRAGTQSVLLLAMVLLAAGIGGVVGRSLLRSLGTLRRTALDVAARRLPEAVANIRNGRTASIDPVPVHTTEEVGQLARAFDTVHTQAVRSAEEEAKLRSSLRNIFVNLSRRSQGLVERQLKLMEQLEQKETDPDQLANLFKLDHLATRMRRNNENLVVLSGAELGRRFTEHVPLADVLRAAVSEVEHYQRAVVRALPRVQVLGYAAGDLVRSIAELVENATAFSPPDTAVVIEGARQADGSVRLEIADEGIGMGDTELAEANGRLAAGGGVDAPVSRQMGLFVVGSLANRHGVQVTLARRGGGQDGLVASVRVPAELIVGFAAPEQRKAPRTENGPRRDAGATAGDKAAGDKAAGPLSSRPRQAAIAQPAAAQSTAVQPTAVQPTAVQPTAVQPVRAGKAEPVLEPVHVVGRLSGQLESVGIFVELPELPVANSPASILFRSEEPAHAAVVNGTNENSVTNSGIRTAEAARPAQETDFSWLNRAAPSAAATQRFAAPAAPPPKQPEKPGELPKRVPQAQLHAGARTQRMAVPKRPVSAERARGFLSNFQAGVRLSKAASADAKADGSGEEKP
jgi:signal transduction histidine kinase